MGPRGSFFGGSVKIKLKGYECCTLVNLDDRVPTSRTEKVCASNPPLGLRVSSKEVSSNWK